MLPLANDDKSYGTINDSSATEVNKQYVVYSQRWAVLMAFSLLSCINNWIWITWSPLAKEIASFWSVPTSSVDNLSAVFMYVYIPLSFPALHLLHKYKLRWGLLVGGSLNFVGSLVRFMGACSYIWVYVGTLLCAISQTLTLAMPPLISALWFQERERGLATSIGVLANHLGSAFGLGITILVDFSPKVGDDDAANERENIDTATLVSYLRLQMLLSGFSLILIALFVRSSSPPTPPSEAAFAQKQTSFMESISLFLGKQAGIMLCVVYGLAVGVLYAVATFLSQMFLDLDQGESEGNYTRFWSEKETGYLGLVHILASVFGPLVSGEYLDRTQEYRGTSIALLSSSIASMLGLFIYLEALSSLRWLPYAAISFAGFFLTGFISVGFEYGTAIAYPADEAVVAGVMNVAAQIGGWMLVGLGDIAVSSIGGMLVAALAIAFSLMVSIRAKSARPVTRSS